MKLTTEFGIYDGDTEDEKKERVLGLLSTIHDFAFMDNHAYWDRASAGFKECVLCYAFMEEVTNAKQIKTDEINEYVLAWCNSLRDYCDDQIVDGEHLQYTVLRVEISDAEDANGHGILHITCYEKGDDLTLQQLHIVPVKKYE